MDYLYLRQCMLTVFGVLDYMVAPFKRQKSNYKNSSDGVLPLKYLTNKQALDEAVQGSQNRRVSRWIYIAC